MTGPFLSVTVAFIPGGVGPMEMLILGAIAVLLFGNRLPSVMRSVGQGIMEFKKGVSGIEDEISRASNTSYQRTPTPRYDDVIDRQEATAPKFEPPPAEPTSEPAAESAGEAAVDSDGK